MKRRSLPSQVQRAWLRLGHTPPFCACVQSIQSHGLNTASSFSPRSDGTSTSADFSPSLVSISSGAVKFTVPAGSLWIDGHQNRNFPRRRLSGSAASPELAAGLQKGVEKEKVDCVVIGAGVVGIAVARELAKRGREVVVVEAAEGIGTGTSSRNSEVIHAGIYYPHGSLKVMSRVLGLGFL